jgi:hypothetical protein
MMWQSPPIAEQRIAICAAHEAVEQSVPVNVASLFSVETEINPAEPMNACSNPGPSTDFLFDFADCPDPRRVKKAGYTE